MSHFWLPLSVILLSGSLADLKIGFQGAMYLFFVVLCKVMFSIQVNDLCDQREDTALGKKRWIAQIPINMGILISIMFVFAGFAIIILKNGALKVILSYGATILLGLFYSLPPVRFKERRVWGLFIYALSATMIYVVVQWMWFNSGMLLLALLFFTVFWDKWVQLHFHQIVDYEADIKSGIRTYAVKAGLKRTRTTLQVTSLFAAFSIFCLLAYTTFGVAQESQLTITIIGTVTIIVAGSGIFAWVSKKKTAQLSDLIMELPWFYLGLTYYAFCALPPLIFVFLALKEPLIWILVILSTFSFLILSLNYVKYKYT